MVGQTNSATSKGEHTCRFFGAVVFIGNFLLVMWLHLDVRHVFELEHAIKVELTDKPFGAHSQRYYDIRTAAEFWDWLENGLLPTVIGHTDAAGHTLPHREWGYFVQYNRVIGGVRVSQKRSETKKCDYSDFDKLYDECHPIQTTDKSTFGYPECSSPEFQAALDDWDLNNNMTACYDASKFQGAVDLASGEGFTYRKGTFAMWIDLLDTDDVIAKRVEYLEDRHFLDKQTKSLEIELLAYNAQTEPLICRAILKFKFDRVGLIVPSAEIETVPLDPYHSDLWLKIALEVCYVAMYMHIFLYEFRMIKRKWREHGRAALRLHYLSGFKSVGHWIDVANIAVGTTVSALWVRFIINLRTVRRLLRSLDRPEGDPSYDDLEAGAWSRYRDDVFDAESSVGDSIVTMQLLRTFSALTLLIMVGRLFRAWNGIPLYKSVSQTIMNASSRLVSFAVIFAFLVLVFSGCGMLAFGQQLVEFHTFSSSVVATLIIISTGDADLYQRQRLVDPFLANLWHWILIMVLNVVCLNLLLAVLVQSYSEISRPSPGEAAPNLALSLKQTVTSGRRMLRRSVDELARTGNTERRRRRYTIGFAAQTALRSAMPNSAAVAPLAEAKEEEECDCDDEHHAPTRRTQTPAHRQQPADDDVVPIAEGVNVVAGDRDDTSPRDDSALLREHYE